MSVAHIARVYNYWLGGKDHFAADRAAGDATIEAYPGIRVSARANRAFLSRAVRYLAETEGIRQFLDIGTGLPTANNTQLAPGVVRVSEWRPDTAEPAAHTTLWGGVGRK